jgi:hypothetical protein
MNRLLVLTLLATALLSACVFQKLSKPAFQAKHGQDQPTAAGGEGGSSVAAAAAKITDACTLMPADLVKQIVPGASAPQSEQHPRRCSVSNGTSVLEITIETGIITPTDPITGAEFISGLAQGGYLERLDPVSRGDTYLTVILGKDPNGLLHVEVAGHDGKDHQDDAIAVARDILAQLK